MHPFQRPAFLEHPGKSILETRECGTLRRSSQRPNNGRPRLHGHVQDVATGHDLHAAAVLRPGHRAILVDESGDGIQLWQLEIVQSLCLRLRQSIPLC